MHLDEAKSGKYVRHLLRESYRQDGKVKHRTIANLSRCSPDEIQAIKLALRHKSDLTSWVSLSRTGSEHGPVRDTFGMAG